MYRIAAAQVTGRQIPPFRSAQRRSTSAPPIERALHYISRLGRRIGSRGSLHSAGVSEQTRNHRQSINGSRQGNSSTSATCRQGQSPGLTSQRPLPDRSVPSSDSRKLGAEAGSSFSLSPPVDSEDLDSPPTSSIADADDRVARRQRNMNQDDSPERDSLLYRTQYYVPYTLVHHQLIATPCGVNITLGKSLHLL